jgi:fibronectin type 3 domain-containing protein
MSMKRPSALRGVAFAATAVLLALSSCSDQITVVDVARVEVAPPAVSVQVGRTASLTARLLGPNGETLAGWPITWRSLNPAVAQVDENGSVLGLASGAATVEASSNGIVGTAAVTVTPGPLIALSAAEVEITAVWNGATPGDRTVTVQNGGDGTLTGLAANVRYTAGQPTGWLTAAVTSTAPASLVLSASQAGLTPGTYTAFVDISSAEAANSPVTLTVRLIVAPPPAAIALGASTLTFARAVGGNEPSEQTVAITNAGGGSLSGLAAAVSYAGGQPTDWLAATLSATTAPATLTVRATAGSLPVGTYSATVSISSDVAQNSPQQIAVTLTVSASTPAIGVAPTTLGFSAQQGEVDPPPQSVQITNIGGGALDGLTTFATYPGGQAAGWLSLQLSGSTAPATLTVGVRSAGLAPGSYAATISIVSAAAVNSPRQVEVSFQVTEAAPAIVATPATVTFTSTSGGTASPAPIAVAITNGGGGTLSGLTATVSYPQGAAPGWLNAQLAGTSAPTTLTLTATRGALPVGTHRAVVRLTAAGAAAIDVPVQYVIAVVVPAPPTSATATPLTHDRIAVAWAHDGANVDRFEIDRSTDAGANWSTTIVAAAGAVNIEDTGLLSSTTYTYRVRACNPIGCSPNTSLVNARTAPAPPANLRASAPSTSRVDLSWDDVSVDETAFVIERSIDGVNWSVVGQVGAGVTAFADLTVAAGTTYRYRVRACRLDACSGTGSIVLVATPVPAPGAPASLTAAAAGPTTVDLSWAASSGFVSGYHIERSTAPASGFAAIDTVPGNQTTFQDAALASSSTYFYRVRGRNATGFSSYSPVASATTAAPPPALPGAPGSLAATAVDTSRISLSWSASTGVVHGYHIERSTTSGSGFVALDTVPAGQTSYQNTGLASNTTYYYRVRARNVSGFSDYSAEASATTATPPPALPGAPGNLAAAAVDTSRIDLSWSASTGVVSGYHIERSTTSGSGFVALDTVPAGQTSYQNTGLASSTTYYYRVRARNVSGFSEYSGEASATTAAPPSAVPGVPGNVQAAALDTARIQLSWTASSGTVTRYQMERSTTSGGSFTGIGSVNGDETSFQDTGLASSTTYYYRVRARNNNAFSDWSDVASATTPAPPPPVPGAPTNLAAAAVDTSRISLSWSASSGVVDGYHIERSTTSGGGFVALDTVPAGQTSYQNTGLASSTTYYYRVRARNVSGFSDYSGEASATTATPPQGVPGAPGNLTAAAVDTSRINLSWSASSGVVDGYHIQRRPASGGGWAAVDTVPGNQTSFQDKGLASATTYQYRVRARNASGFSEFSAEASATTAAPASESPSGPSTDAGLADPDPAMIARSDSYISPTEASPTGLDTT